MGDVFLLGAGFSNAVSDEIPLLKDLSDEIARVKRPLPDPLARLGDLERLGHDLEGWLSFLSQSHPWLSEQENLRNRAVALDVTERIREILGRSEKRTVDGSKCPGWLQDLVTFLAPRKVWRHQPQLRHLGRTSGTGDPWPRDPRS